MICSSTILLLVFSWVCNSWRVPSFVRRQNIITTISSTMTSSLPLSSSSNKIPNFAEDDPLGNMRPIFNPDNDISTSPRPTLLEPTFADMKEMAFILANITEHLDTQPEIAITVASQRMGWLYSRDIPKLTQMLLQEFPAFRQDESMMRAYLFLLDFLEAIVKETNVLQEKNQKALRVLLEAAKISEQQVDLVIMDSKEQLTKPEFMLYLDAEIESHDPNSPFENMLVTIKLRLLDEIGKGMGVDVMILPKLAAEENPSELRRKTMEHLQNYDAAGCELFLQTLRLMRMEMKKRYQQLDVTLMMNLGEVEKITESFLNNKQT